MTTKAQNDQDVLLCAAIRQVAGAPGVAHPFSIEGLLRLVGARTHYRVPKRGNELQGVLADMCQRGLLTISEKGLSLTESGQRRAAKADAEMVQNLTAAAVLHIFGMAP